LKTSLKFAETRHENVSGDCLGNYDG